MDDFIKTKSWVAIALLAALLIMNPIVSKFGEVSFDMTGFKVKLIYSYYATFAFLGAAVYFYSLHFFTSKKFKLQQTIGNICYAVSFSVSLLYNLIFIAHYLINSLKTKEGIQSLEITTAVLLGCLVTTLAFIIARAITSRDKIEIGEQYEKEEFSFIHRSQMLYDDKYYDLAVIEVLRPSRHLSEMGFCGAMCLRKDFPQATLLKRRTIWN